MRPNLSWMGACLALAVAFAPAARAEPAALIGTPRQPTAGNGFEGDPFTVLNAQDGMPENGVVLIRSAQYGAVPFVNVSSTVSLDVEGSLTEVPDGRHWVWAPAEPWSLDQQYEVEIGMPEQTGLPSALTMLTIVPAIELAKPSIVLTPSVSSISVITDKTCCRTRDATAARLIDSGHCFAIEEEASVQLDAGVVTLTPRLHAGQYLFRFSTGPDQRAVYTDASFVNLVLPVFREQADRYCFELTAIELPTMTEHAYEELDGCAEHGSLDDLGKRAVEPGETELDRLLCHAPPAGYEDAWCELNAACDGDAARSCALYPHVCDGEPLEALPAAPASGSGDAAVSGSGDGDDPGDGEGSDAGSGGRDTGGCTAARAGEHPGGLGGALIATSLAVAWIRRVRRRGPRCATRA